MSTELQAKRGELEQQSAELEERLTRVGWLLNMLERLWPKFVRWLSHPDLPEEIKEEGIGIVAEAVSVWGHCGRTIRIRDACSAKLKVTKRPASGRGRLGMPTAVILC